MPKIKNFLAFIDVRTMKLINQKIQQMTITNFASKKNGRIAKYETEEGEPNVDMPILDLCLENMKDYLTKVNDYDGIIFFTLDQFCYSGSFNFKLLNKTLKKTKIFFAKEEISILSKKDLYVVFNSIYLKQLLEPHSTKQYITNYINKNKNLIS